MNKTGKILFFTLLFLLLSNSSLLAQTNEKDAFSLQIYPPITEITANVGTQPESSIQIRNTGENTANLDIQFKVLKASQEGNGKIEYLDEASPAQNILFKNIKILDKDQEITSLELKPLEARNLKLKITLNENIEPGDYYFSIIFISKDINDTQKSSVSIPGGISTNIILAVDNKEAIKAEILEFSAPWIMTSGPVPITLLLKNDGKRLFKPSGTITIRDMFGKNVARIELLPDIVLSGAKRYIRDIKQATPSADNVLNNRSLTNPAIVWPEKFLFGLYTINLDVKTSETEPSFQRTISFIAVPVFFIFTVSLVIFIILGILIRARKEAKN